MAYIVDWKDTDGKQHTSMVEMKPVGDLKQEHLAALAKAKLMQKQKKVATIVKLTEAK